MDGIWFDKLEKQLDTTRVYQNPRARKKMWETEIINRTNSGGIILEFGVASGNSIGWFPKHFPGVPVHGFDSFEGLPEAWDLGETVLEKGHFSTNGKTPSTEYKEITYWKGWFNDTLPGFLKEHKNEKIKILHLDADLYSSTKYIFDNIYDMLDVGTIILFDELTHFPDHPHYKHNRVHEYKAFKEFCEKHPEFDFETLGRTDRGQVAIQITQLEESSPLQKYVSKNILVLGAGTSTLDVKWENLDYDYVWTCNDFYISKRLNDTKIDLALISYNTDITNKQLLDRIDKDKPDLLIEPLHYREKINSKELKDFALKYDVFFTNIPLQSIAGAAARLVQLAQLCHAKNIYFAGVDGFNKDFTNKHAFTEHVGLKDTDTRREYNIYLEGFIKCFNQYLENDYSGLQNLGEGKDYNCGTVISKEYFPLREEIKEKIK